MRLGILTSHPIQYHSPWFRELASRLDLHVFYAHRPSPEEQGGPGFGKAFEWDIDLLAGYPHSFLRNVASQPGVDSWSGCDTPDIADAIASGGFDAFVVTGWYLKSYWQAIRACRRYKVPVLVRGDSQLQTPRSPVKRIAKELIYRVLLRQIDAFLVVGVRFGQYLQHYGVAADRMFRVPHFVDNRWFAEKAESARVERANVRGGWGADDQTLVVLFVGKFIWQKRGRDLIEAIARLSPAIKAVGVFVGTGPLEAEFRAAAQQSGADMRFEGFQNQSQLPRFYAAADVLALPSESETWGLVVNEAMACGLPAIVSDAVGCAPDLVDEGVTGFTYPVGNVAELNARLAQLHAMTRRGHDWRPALQKKIAAYSVDVAAAGTLEAVTAVRLR